jgi:hypothetical protein
MTDYEVPDALKDEDEDGDGVEFVMPDALKEWHR